MGCWKKKHAEVSNTLKNRASKETYIYGLYDLIRAVRGKGVSIQHLLVDCSAQVKVESNDNE